MVVISIDFFLQKYIALEDAHSSMFLCYILLWTYDFEHCSLTLRHEMCILAQSDKAVLDFGDYDTFKYIFSILLKIHKR